MNVQLRNFIALSGACISNVHTNFRRSSRANLRGLDMNIFIPKCRVAQPIAKWIERRSGAERVGSIGGRLVIVKIGKIANRVGECNGLFSPGIHVSEQHIGCRTPAFLPEIPSFENRGNVFGNIVYGKRASID